MLERIRIAQFVDSLGTGGIEQFVFNVLDNLDTDTFDCSIITSEVKTDNWNHIIESKNVNIIKLVTNLHCTFKLFRKIKKLESFKYIIKANDFDVVHIHMSYSSTLLYCAIAKRLGVPLVIAHSHTNSFGEVSQIQKIASFFSKSVLLKYCDLFFAPSNDAGKHMFGSKQRIEIIHNGISISEFEFSDTIRNDIRKKLGVREEEVLVGHVGRFTKVKNHEFLIDIFESLKTKIPNAKLLLVGEGETEKSIRDRVKNKSLSESVIFCGYRKNTSELYQAMDVFVLPSLYEGLGIVAIEAQTSGLPVLMSETIPDETIISDYCRKASLNDTADFWAEQIEKLLPHIRERNESSHIFNTEYDIKAVANKISNIYMSKGEKICTTNHL